MNILVPAGTVVDASRRIRAAVEVGRTDRDFVLLVNQVLADLDLVVITGETERTRPLEPGDRLPTNPAEVMI